jgi:hypothetical protein
VLTKGSETLAGISETFSALMKNWKENVGCPESNIYCFYEELPVPLLGVRVVPANPR